MNIKHLFILPAITLGAIVSCSSGGGNADGYTDKDMVISALPKTEIIVSEETTLSVANEELNKKVTWSTKSPEICSINNDGVVKGLKEGECELNATYKSLVSSFTVSVIPNSSVLDVVLSDENVFLSLEDSYVVSAYATYQDVVVLEKIDFTWTSKNESVVKAVPSTDTSEATLIPTGVGVADVLVSATYKGVDSICGLSVVVSEHSISFSLTSADPKLTITPTTGGYDAEITGFNISADFNCAVFVDGEEKDELDIIWSSTNPTVCEVTNINNRLSLSSSTVTGDCVITGNYKNIASVTLNVTVKESA